MELGTEKKINICYNSCFYPTVCHVCKGFGGNVPLKRWVGCDMIGYCSEEHQIQHWPEHKTLCNIIQNVLRDKCTMETHNVTWQERMKMKLDLMQTISSILERPLRQYEKQMFEFPRECFICYEQDIKSLVTCRNCVISLCKAHKNDTRHKNICAPLELAFRINFTTCAKRISVDLHYLQYITSNSKTFQDMKDFMNIYGNTRAGLKMSDIFVAQHSVFLTRPLTLFHAMQILNYPNRKKLLIHVIGANFREENTLRGWEILLHLIETEVLLIMIIGTKLKYQSRLLPICGDCLSRGKKISLQFHNVLYESYVCSPWFVKPDLTVGFDVDIEKQTFRCIPTETTKLSIQMLAKQNCPFLLTSHTQQEMEECINNINIILDRKVDYLYGDKNPFASLRPHRSVGREQVFYQNNFMIVYRSLLP